MKNYSYLSLFVLLIIAPIQSAETNSVLICVGNGKERIHLQPKGPFAVLEFCEDALANYIALIYYGKMASPISGSWRINDRIWQNSDWSSDVSSFAWDPKGNYLFVATNAIYGTGAIYQLNLLNRNAHRLFPDSMKEAKQICYFNIKHVEPNTSEIIIVGSNCENEDTIEMRLKYAK